MRVERIVALVNEVYLESEAGFWAEGYERTSEEDIRAAIDAGELLVVDGGLVRTRVDGDVGWFGMLAVDPAARGTGLGRRLVDAAEQRARDAGATQMQLELLTPDGWQQDAKATLDAWYHRLGYVVVERRDFALDYPQLALRLARPATLVVYRKPLTP